MRLIVVALLPALAAAYYKHVGYIGPREEQSKHNTFNCSATGSTCVTEATKACDDFAGCLSFGIAQKWHGGRAAQLYLTDFNKSYKDDGWTLYSKSNIPPATPPTPPPTPPTPSPPTPPPTPPPPCTSDLGCSLNGVCTVGSGICVCDKPWYVITL
jgi:hypothetical protein